MRNLRFSLRDVMLAVMVLAFSIPALAQQQGPMQPIERQQPAPPPNTPAPPASTAPPPAAGTPSTPSAGASAAAAPANGAPSTPKPGSTVEVPIGTSLPLVLHNGISTHSAKVGDPVYFETLFPIMIDGRVAIPAGSYVSGEVTETKRAGRVKGRAELMIKLNAVPRSAGTGGGEKVDNEGKVVGDSNKAGDVGTVAKTTAAGAGIGGLATRGAQGVGIGAGVGAAAGLMAVLLTRGPDAELPRGTTVDVTLNRPILLDAEKDQFTGPGQASTLAGPQNRESHGKIPF